MKKKNNLKVLKFPNKLNEVEKKLSDELLHFID